MGHAAAWSASRRRSQWSTPAPSTSRASSTAQPLSNLPSRALPSRGALQ
jgi:hypothetical protein